MSVVDRSALEASPLADLHAIASELSIDGYRRLRRAELIDAILDRQEGGNGASAAAEAPEAPEAAEAASTTEATPTRRRRSRKAAEPAEPVEEASVEAVEEAEPVESAEAVEVKTETESEGDDEDEEPAGRRRRRGRRGGRGRATGRDDADSREDEERPEAEPEADSDTDSEEVVEGVVELLANGSGFVRVDPPDPSDDDVYISSAQVKRCELVSGDRIAGPKRAPRRSERFASLIRIETINGRPAAELADSVRFDDLPAAFPTERLKIGADDPTLKAIEWLTPFGLGSRVTIVGASRSGKSEAVRRLAAAMTEREELSVSVVLAGVRPEEIFEWNDGPVTPSAAVSLAASEDARSGAVEPAIDQARRLAARGADAVVFIDTLDGCSPALARKALAAARNIVGGGSVTVIATASAPIGGETTVIALDVALTSAGRFPALDLAASGTMRPELLVGAAGAEAIAKTRAEDG
ncbi:MAG TPA: Rho termination factor N-terminal domain-containing protein [Solirubrobacteraceae bacterium]|nr:Rho termination factor N-terminal domain-containing protein [Solirubrobacteraceae bacterium]